MTQPYGQDPAGGSDPYAQQDQPYGRQPPYGQPQNEQYGQQQYGQPQYGQPPSAMANAYGEPIGSGARFGVVAATFAGIGAVLLLISFTALDWFKGGNSTFGDVHDVLDSAGSQASSLSTAYFGWLGWLLLIAAVGLAIAAALPSAVSGPLRAGGAVVAAAAVILTLFAIDYADGLAYSDAIKNARVGFYFALAGFLCCFIGALAGPSNRR